jgi:HPr kinase/phosphorylase
MKNADKCILPSIQVKDLITEEASELKVKILEEGKGLKNVIRSVYAEKPGLALSGFAEAIHPGSIQILGKSEISFINQKSKEERIKIIREVCSQNIPCFILAGGVRPPQVLLHEAKSSHIPVLKSSLRSSVIAEKLTRFLEDKLAPRFSIHGVLLDVYGLGILLLGESGVGKSECALDLIVRGHRLISDDIVEIRRKGVFLVGQGAEMARFHMELRGLGIISVYDLFGVAAVRFEKIVEYVIQLDRWKEGKEYDRLGIEDNTYEILGIKLPFTIMPVAPGRNISVLIEVAARNYLLKKRGIHPAKELEKRLMSKLRREGNQAEEGE